MTPKMVTGFCAENWDVSNLWTTIKETSQSSVHVLCSESVTCWGAGKIHLQTVFVLYGL